jgi:hypothetical protein
MAEFELGLTGGTPSAASLGEAEWIKLPGIHPADIVFNLNTVVR